MQKQTTQNLPTNKINFKELIESKLVKCWQREYTLLFVDLITKIKLFEKPNSLYVYPHQTKH